MKTYQSPKTNRSRLCWTLAAIGTLTVAAILAYPKARHPRSTPTHEQRVEKIMETFTQNATLPSDGNPRAAKAFMQGPEYQQIRASHESYKQHLGEFKELRNRTEEARIAFANVIAKHPNTPRHPSVIAAFANLQRHQAALWSSAQRIGMEATALNDSLRARAVQIAQAVR